MYNSYEIQTVYSVLQILQNLEVVFFFAVVSSIMAGRCYVYEPLPRLQGRLTGAHVFPAQIQSSCLSTRSSKFFLNNFIFNVFIFYSLFLIYHTSYIFWGLLITSFR